MAPIRTQDSHETNSAGQGGATQQARPSVRDRYSGASPLGRENSAYRSPSTPRNQVPDSSSGSESKTQLGDSFADFAARQLYDSTSLPTPKMKGSRLSESKLRKLPHSLRSSLAPIDSLTFQGHDLLGIDLTPLSEPDYDVLERTDMGDSDSIMYLREITKLSELDVDAEEEDVSESSAGGETGAESMNSMGEMTRFFEVFHRAVAIVANDVPYIRELAPPEQMRVISNVLLLYRTGYLNLKGQRYPSYPCYPTWRGLKGARQPPRPTAHDQEESGRFEEIP